MSLLLRPKLEPAKAPMLTLVMALSAAEAIEECVGLPVQIKWPNDIVINGKKIVGILTEMSTEVDYINHVVIGVGINVNIGDFPSEIQKTASSLCTEAGHPVKRAPIIAAILKKFERYYEEFLDSGDLSPLQEAYNHMLVNCGREVRILGEREEYTAKALGINSAGELLVCRKDGREEAIYAGEVSVRGVYGYV